VTRHRALILGLSSGQQTASPRPATIIALALAVLLTKGLCLPKKRSAARCCPVDLAEEGPAAAIAAIPLIGAILAATCT